jgi:hypothetical protein
MDNWKINSEGDDLTSPKWSGYNSENTIQITFCVKYAVAEEAFINVETVQRGEGHTCF